MARALRKDVYESIVHQPLEFFTTKAHSTGNLTGMLAEEIRSVNASAINMYFLLLQGFVGIISGLTISLIFSWKMGLVASILLPTLLFLIYINFKLKKMDAIKHTGYTEKSRVIISDGVLNHTTASTLANEQILVDRYFKKEKKGKLQKLFLGLKSGVCLGCSELSMTLFYYPMLILYADGIEKGGKLILLRLFRKPCIPSCCN